MANRKVKATDKKNFILTPQFPKFAGYADYFLSTPVSVQIRNDSAEAALLRVFIESDSGLIVPFETQAEVPFESAVALSAEGITQVSGLEHIRRGYEDLEGQLAALGASVQCHA